MVKEKNLKGEPTSVPSLLARLKELHHDLSISERTLNRLLHRAGFVFARGSRRSVLVESSYVKAFRARCISAKLANRGGNKLPILPEVFLDESYCHENHAKQFTWLDTNSMIQYEKSGKGRRMVVVGAGVVFAQDNAFSAAFVEDSVQYWDAGASTGDYHGNFTSDTFERWFENLCYTLMMSYGQCRVCLDGASYHLRVLNPRPTTAWRKADITTWLLDRGVTHDETMLTKELLELSRRVKEEKEYATVQIAAEYGHYVHVTPPYHPELQPIEIIWAVVKNHVAANPPSSMSDLRDKLRAGFKKVNKKTWKGAYSKVQAEEDLYAAIAAGAANEAQSSDEEEEHEGDGDLEGATFQF